MSALGRGKGATPEPDEAPKPTEMPRREQQIGYVLAGVAGAGSATLATTGSGDVLLAGIGGVVTVILVLAVRRRHRIFTAVAGFLAGLVFSSFFFPLELAFLLFSFYLMMRTSNAQSKLRRSQSPMTAADRRAAAEARAAQRAERRKEKGKGADTDAPVAKVPPANRRYTPPKGKPTRRP